MKHKDLGFVLGSCLKLGIKLRIHEMLGYAVQISEAMAFIASV